MLTANVALPLLCILLGSVKKHTLPAEKNLANDLFKLELENETHEPQSENQLSMNEFLASQPDIRSKSFGRPRSDSLCMCYV